MVRKAAVVIPGPAVWS